MTTKRLMGIFLIGLASLGTILASFYLAQQASSDTEINTILLQSVVVFIVVAPIFGAGYYLYVTGEIPDDPNEVTEMELQRHLVELLDQAGSMSLAELATVQGVTQNDIRAMIYDLTRLELFNGIITSDGVVMRTADPRMLQLATQCQTCGAPIQIEKGSIVCATCGTEYLLS